MSILALFNPFLRLYAALKKKKMLIMSLSLTFAIIPTAIRIILKFLIELTNTKF
jgi:hypothetical protein